MRHWLQLATRNWRTRAGRSALAVTAVALGVGVVVWVTCCYESVRRGVTSVVLDWIGRSHVVVESTAGVWGHFDAEVANWVRDINGISRSTTRTREYLEIAARLSPDSPAASRPGTTFAGEPATPPDDAFIRVEVTGIEPAAEIDFRRYVMASGRMLAPSDHQAIMLEVMLARQLGVNVGDAVCLRHPNSDAAVRAWTVVGIVERRRASLNQALMAWMPLSDVQTLSQMAGRIKSVELIAADPNYDSIRKIADTVRKTIETNVARMEAAGESPPRLEVRTTEAQLRKLGAAQGLLQFIMMLLACVVMLTAFFIIIATMSMGVTERIAELGLLRCIGVTRRQLCTLIFVQALPFGAFGVILGVPLGLGLQWLTLQFVPEYLGHFAISQTGIALAVCGGFATTLVGAAFPAVRAFEVSPVEAARSPADPEYLRWVWIAAGLAIVMLVAHELLNRSLDTGSAVFDAQSVGSVLLLYTGAALLMPLLVIVLGKSAVFLAGRCLGLRHELLGEEVQKAPFRSAAICCGLMVGLSLIVGLVVWGKSVKQGWQFPREFPDALIYFYEGRPLDKVRELRNLPGIKDFAVTDDFGYSLRPPGKRSLFGTLSVMENLQRFLAIDPDEAFRIIRLTFLEGDQDDARLKLKQGGHILVTREFASAHGKKLGDKVRIYANSKRADFIIAGIIASPGLDIAISFFNAESYFQSYSVGAIVGTLEDAKMFFGIAFGKLLLINFDFEEKAEPLTSPDAVPGFIPGANSAPDGRPTFALTGNSPLPGTGPEIDLVNEILRKMNYPVRAFVTARELKKQIDSNIDRVTLLLSAVPFVGLLISAIGLANLMAASVTSRAREFAVLRAIGITRSQLIRMVVGESLVLAIIGSAAGLSLGLILGRTSNLMTEMLSGFHPEFAVPWALVAAGAALATLLCVFAALGPARYAGRTNIVAALQD
ncbi:MAG: ABC transporter permease [Phycisphaerae bacterium]|nr:ABC transporter permease [Phycisphaerae bacterium]